MNKEFTRMQKLAGIITEGLYTSDAKASLEAMSHESEPKMTKKVLKEKIKNMMMKGEGYQGSPYDSSEEMALDMIKTGAGLPGGSLEETPEDIATREMGSMDEDASDISSSVSKSSVEVLVAAARRIIGALKDSGFEQEDIYDYIMDKVKTLSVDEALFEAKKDGEVDTEEVIVAKDEVPAEGAPAEDVTDTTADIDMDGTPDIDTGSPEAKKTLTALMDSFNAAKQLGDPKLIQMAANQLTYFNKNILFKAGQPQA
jgi:hypothetical protein